METVIEQIPYTEKEQVVIKCYRVTSEVRGIVEYISKAGATLTGYINDAIAQVNLRDILYVESVDSRTFAYTQSDVFMLKYKLYEFEDLYTQRHFFRCSKAFIINLMKIDTVKPILNGRYCATMCNGEEIIISRQYVSLLKRNLLEEQR